MASLTMSIRCDDSRSPLLLVSFEPMVTDVDLRHLDEFVFPAFEHMVRERRGGVLLVNLLPGATFSASQRQILARTAKLHEELVRRACLGVGVVVHSSMQRGLLTALGWLIPSPVLVPFGSLLEAESWARQQFAKVMTG